MSEHYGKARMGTIRAAVNELRAAIRAEGTPTVQDAWDRMEPWIDADIWAETDRQNRKGQ
jgi:hypothetical protein